MSRKKIICTRPDLRPATSIEKALAVLSAFRSQRRSRGIAELAAELGLPRPTLHRILKQLAAWGFVEQLPSNRYRIGLTVFELGTLYPQTRLNQIASRHLHDLHEQTKCSVYLTIRTGDEAMHIDYIPGKDMKRIPMRVGGRSSLHCSSVGKVLLAGAAREDIERYLRQPLEPETRFSMTDATLLSRHLAQVRECRFGPNQQETIMGVYGLAGGITDSSGNVVAAICVAAADREVLYLKDPVGNAALRISRELGSSGIH